MKSGNAFPFHTLLPLAILGCSLSLLPGILQAQERTPQHPKIEQYLNPDGTLKRSGFTSGEDGKFDVGSETPSLPFLARSSAPGDEYWDDRFGASLGSSGVDDEIFAMVSNGSHIYIGGAFSKAGDISVNNLVSWDGEQWGRVGPGPGILNGVNGIVNALAIDGGTLYVGGQFDTAGAKPIRNIAFYDIVSKSWRSMGDVRSTTGTAFISTLLVHGDSLYVGGVFDRIGNRTVQNVAVYNMRTSQWGTLGSGVDGSVNALAAGPDGIYVGGSFSSAGGTASSGVARWDGSEWHGLAGGVNGFVNAIAVMDNTVFVAGGFDRAGDTAVSNIARWRPDTATWTRLSGIFWLSGQDVIRLEGNGVDNVVRSLAVRGKELFVGGTFVTAFPEDYTTTTATVRYVARWSEFDGNPLFNTLWWGRLGEGMNGFVNSLVFHDDALYVGGAFTQAGGVPADGIARWDGLRWFSLAKGTGNNLFALDAKDGEVWVGGEFNQPGIGIGTRLARLDGSKWQLIPGLFAGSIYTVAAKDEWVYVGGRFSGNTEVGSNNIIRYNSTTGEWSRLGSSTGPNNPSDNGFVSAIAFDGDYVYLGGDFTEVDGMPAYSLVRWNSATDVWDTVGRGVNGQVFAIAVDGNDLYVGGRFLGAGDLLLGSAREARNVARWDGDERNWFAMEEGVNEVVWDMVVKDGKVYLGGSFDSAGSLRAPSVVRWDINSGSWESPGEGLEKEFLPSVNSLSATRNYVYAGGSFLYSGQDSLSNVARWDGTDWQSLGSGVDNYVYVVDADGEKVYVAGAFLEAGGKSSFYFGIYSDPVLSVKEHGTSGGATFDQVSPNPVTESATLTFRTTGYEHVTLSIHTTDGKEVTRLIDHNLPAGEHRLLWEPEASLPTGAYIVRLKAGDEVLVRKIIRQ